MVGEKEFSELFSLRVVGLGEFEGNVIVLKDLVDFVQVAPVGAEKVCCSDFAQFVVIVEMLGYDGWGEFLVLDHLEVLAGFRWGHLGCHQELILWVG